MDDITFVRSHWWLVPEGFSLSTANSDVQKLPATLYHRIADSLLCRLKCVKSSQEGERLRGFDVNTLTVVAMESYEEFAENLQQEIEEDTGIRFGVVEAHQFAAIPLVGDEGQTGGLRVRGVERIVGTP